MKDEYYNNKEREKAGNGVIRLKAISLVSILIILVFAFFYSFYYVSAEEKTILPLLNGKDKVDSPRLELSSFTIETKDAGNVIWYKEGNKFYPEFIDNNKYMIINNKTILKPLNTFSFKVNKLEGDTDCKNYNQFYTECSKEVLSFKDFEAKNNITSKEIYVEEKGILIRLAEWLGFNFPDYYVIQYNGTIVDLDPSLELVFTTSQYGFFNQTNATINGVRLQYNNLTGDYKSYIWYNQSKTFWNITLGLLNVSTNINITLQTRTANTYNISDPSLVGLWGFNGNANDELGRNNGTCGAICATLNSTGVVGDEYSFVGGARLTMGNGSDFRILRDITLSAWIGADAHGTGTYPRIVGKEGSYFMILTGSSGKLRWFDAAIDTEFSGSPNLKDNKKHFIVTTYNGTGISGYVDGLFIGAISKTANFTDLPNINLTVGNRDTGARGFNGTIDEVRVYNRSLSASEVLDLYNFGTTYFSDISDWSSESLVNDNIATLVNTNSTFMQFRAKLYTNTTETSPVLTNYSILQHTSGGGTPPSDTIYPIFSSYWDNNATLVDSGLGLFNVTVENTNGTVWLEVTTNHTAVNLTSNMYNASKGFITSGVYSYRWYAYGNGTNKNLNYSSLRSYTVNSSGDTTPPYFTTIPANATITYGESLGVQFAGTDAVSFETYYLGNWTNGFSINSTGWLKNITSLSAGTYQINVTINDSVGNTNMTWYKLIINKATSQTGLTFDKATPQEYGIVITPTCTLITGVGSVSLTNGTSGVPELLGAGIWNINCSYAGNTNYSSSSNLTSYTINKNSSLILGISGTTPIDYGTTTDVAGSGCPTQLSCSLSPSNAIFSAGVKTFNYSTSGNNNYTASSITKDITINKVAPSLSVGANPSWNTNNNTEVTITGSGCPAQLTCELYKDNGLESNPFVSYFTQGSYSFVYNTTGNANYTIGSDSNTLVITNYTAPPPAGNVTTTSVARCRYKKLGYYNLKLPWLRQEDCN